MRFHVVWVVFKKSNLGFIGISNRGLVLVQWGRQSGFGFGSMGPAIRVWFWFNGAGNPGFGFGSMGLGNPGFGFGSMGLGNQGFGFGSMGISNRGLVLVQWGAAFRGFLAWGRTGLGFRCLQLVFRFFGVYLWIVTFFPGILDAGKKTHPGIRPAGFGIWC